MTHYPKHLIAYLYSLYQPPRVNRVALAALRRGLGKPPGSVVSMFPYVIPHAPPQQSEQWPYFLVAALFASYPDAPPYYADFGASFRRLDEVVQRKPMPERNRSIQSRFVALLRAEPMELPTYLRHAVALMAAHSVGISWDRLLHDLIHWGDSPSTVSLRWAGGFWGSTAHIPPSSTTTTPPEEDAHA